MIENKEEIKQFIINNPSFSIKDVARAMGVGYRTISYLRAELADTGQIPLTQAMASRGRKKKAADFKEEVSNALSAIPYEAPTLDGKRLRDLATSESIEDEISDDYETQRRLLNEVKNLAFNLSLPSDTRLSAMQVWVKIKDIAASKDIGPGPPRTEEDIISRLIRIMLAVGPRLSLSALEKAFSEKGSDGEKGRQIKTEDAEGGETSTSEPTS